MKVTLNKKLHERALSIIEIIETAERRIKRQEFNKVEIPSVFFNIKDSCDKRIATHREAIKRLEKSYIETVNRINKAI